MLLSDAATEILQQDDQGWTQHVAQTLKVLLQTFPKRTVLGGGKVQCCLAQLSSAIAKLTACYVPLWGAEADAQTWVGPRVSHSAIQVSRSSKAQGHMSLCDDVVTMPMQRKHTAPCHCSSTGTCQRAHVICRSCINLPCSCGDLAVATAGMVPTGCPQGHLGHARNLQVTVYASGSARYAGIHRFLKTCRAGVV